MVLFAHLVNKLGTEIDVEGSLQDLPIFTSERPFRSRSKSEDVEVSEYWSSDREIKVQIRHTKDKPELVTIETDLETAKPSTINGFRQSVEALEARGLSVVSDKSTFSDYDHSLYWGRISDFIDSCRPPLPRPYESLSTLIEEPRTGEIVVSPLIENKDCELKTEIGIEFDKVRGIKSLKHLKEVREDHINSLVRLGKFIQYADISRKGRGRRDPKVAILLDDILEVGYGLLSYPADHASFGEFLDFVIEKDDEDRESLYHTLDLIHAAVVLVKGEMGKTFPQTPQINETLLDIGHYGPVYMTMQKIRQIGESLHVPKISIDRMLNSKYSDGSLLHTLVDIENALSKTGEDGSVKLDSKLARVMKNIFRYGDFKSYLKSESGEMGRKLLSKMEEMGFNTDLVTSNHLSADILGREETSLTYWEKNFDDLIKDIRDPRYSVFFMRYDGEREVLNGTMRDKVFSLSSSQGAAYIANKVRVMLEHCRRREGEKEEHGKKVDDPLKELEEKLENLQIQMEFGGRPVGGMLYSRAWHRTPEDFSRDDFMLCCASLGGEKEDLTFKAIFNPAHVYVMHFIHGIDNSLGFSILKAGTTEGNRAMLSISPYEANPAIRTALGEANTYRYALDAMARTAFIANAEVLLIDDIDLKVRDENGNVVRCIDGGIITLGQEGYELGEDVIIRYRNGEACAPRSFRKFMEKSAKKYSSIIHGDANFEQISGDNELVESQFENFNEEAPEFHYSIQSVRPVFKPETDYRKLTPEETKNIFDQGYGPQNGTRTVFKIDLNKYLEERQSEGINLREEASMMYGNTGV